MSSPALDAASTPEPETLPRRDGFRLRGRGDVSRLEGFSDAVFGFAVTLLVVSLDVPHTFAELHADMQGFLGFAISFALLFLLWHVQYKHFRRYALDDSATVLLTAVLLFLVVFFVYPLKFVFTLLANQLLGAPWLVRARDGTMQPPLAPGELPRMMEIYGLGYSAIFTVYALLFWNALRQAARLGLDALERLGTRSDLRGALINVGIGAFSVSLAAAGRGGLSALAFVLIAPLMIANRLATRRTRGALEQALRNQGIDLG